MKRQEQESPLTNSMRKTFAQSNPNDPDPHSRLGNKMGDVLGKPPRGSPNERTSQNEKISKMVIMENPHIPGIQSPYTQYSGGYNHREDKDDKKRSILRDSHTTYRNIIEDKINKRPLSSKSNYQGSNYYNVWSNRLANAKAVTDSGNSTSLLNGRDRYIFSGTSDKESSSEDIHTSENNNA